MTTLSDAEWTAILLSLKVAALACVGSLPFAIAIAYLLARKQFPGKSVVNALVHLPLVLPPVVTGWALLIAFGREGPAGRALLACCGVTLAFRFGRAPRWPPP